MTNKTTEDYTKMQRDYYNKETVDFLRVDITTIPAGSDYEKFKIFFDGNVGGSIIDSLRS